MHPFPHPPHLPARALAPSHSRERELASMRVGRWGGGGAGCVDCARASQAAGCVCAGGTSVGGVATRQQQWGAAGAVGLGHAPPPLHSTRAHLPPPPCCRCCCSMRGLSAITPQRPWVPDVVHTPCLACATHPPPPFSPPLPPLSERAVVVGGWAGRASAAAEGLVVVPVAALAAGGGGPKHQQQWVAAGGGACGCVRDGGHCRPLRASLHLPPRVCGHTPPPHSTFTRLPASSGVLRANTRAGATCRCRFIRLSNPHWRPEHRCV